APMHAEPTLASAIQIGNPVSIRRAVRVLEQYEGIVEQATEEELADAAARADLTGMFSCPHTGVALAALIKLCDRGIIQKSHRVVVISTASGLKFSDFKVRYHEGTLPELRGRFANRPVELAPRYDDVKRAVLEGLS